MAGLEIVLPLKYKTLVDLVGFIDQSLTFLKQCRKLDRVFFLDVCESVKTSFGRDLNVNILRQILKVVPEFYTHSWVRSKLVIDCNQDLKIQSLTQTRL